MTCHACGANLASTARFCHKCGAHVGGAQAAGWRSGLPWGVAGAALGALLTVVALRQGAGGREPEAGQVNTPAPGSQLPAPGSQLPAPDISQMSPEERATRLYNRVMTLHSQGKADSAAFFLPMAIQAYAMLPALDVDGRYHIGVLDLTAGDATAALAQADTIRRTVPTHLFALMLRARALELERDTAGARRAYRDFLRSEPAERARRRPEYNEHGQNLDAFHEQATEATAGGAKRGGR
ncbi:MAG TPA: zinc ribbon domain-containing protein [Gemmatimonadales bacterium]|nr:zinc ribbon domain-containing protein [Gemmatimonadales bacterium]